MRPSAPEHRAFNCAQVPGGSLCLSLISLNSDMNAWLAGLWFMKMKRQVSYFGGC